MRSSSIMNSQRYGQPGQQGGQVGQQDPNSVLPTVPEHSELEPSSVGNTISEHSVNGTTVTGNIEHGYRNREHGYGNTEHGYGNTPANADNTQPTYGGIPPPEPVAEVPPSWQAPPLPTQAADTPQPRARKYPITNNNNNDPYQSDEFNLTEYKDNIRFLDCNNFFRNRLRLPFIGPTDCKRLWLVKDCAGIAGTIFTWFLIVFGEIVFFIFVITEFHDPVWGAANGVLSLVWATLGFIAHVRCVFMDPGAVPRGNATKENIQKLGLKDGQIVFKCPKCVSIKPERAHHCSVCRRCIRKMDHHCPWVNNCIGENNQKFFVLFTMYICLISCHALYMAIHHFVVCIRNDWKDRFASQFGGMLKKGHNDTAISMDMFLREECTVFSPAATTIFMIFLLFEALLFGIFTAIMCGTQMSAICSDETAIEQLKNEQNPNWEKKSMWLSIKAVFGHPFSYRWFSPFHTTNSGKDKLYLYNV